MQPDLPAALPPVIPVPMFLSRLFFAAAQPLRRELDCFSQKIIVQRQIGPFLYRCSCLCLSRLLMLASLLHIIVPPDASPERARRDNANCRQYSSGRPYRARLAPRLPSPSHDPIFSVTIAPEISDIFTANVPPNPQQSSANGSGTSSSPLTFCIRAQSAHP